MSWEQIVKDNISLLKEDTLEELYRKLNPGDRKYVSRMLLELGRNPCTMFKLYVPTDSCMAVDTLTKVVLRDTVIFLGHEAFKNCKQLTSFRAGNDLQAIYNEVFYGCDSLSEVYLPEGLLTIENNAFGNCPKLTTIHYAGSKDKWRDIDKSLSWNRNSNSDNIIRHIICNDGVIDR